MGQSGPDKVRGRGVERTGMSILRPEQWVAETMAIAVEVNGKACSFDEGITLGEVIRRFDIREVTVAAALNGEVVPRGRHEATVLCEGDRLEIIRPVQGG